MKKSLFFIFIFIFIIGKFLAYKTSPTTKPNYFYFESINLKQHIISTGMVSKPAIFILGSSGTAGSNIPQGTTISDYFNNYQNKYYAYNLASLQATVVDSVIMLNKGLEYKKPEYVILGIGPDIFSDSSGSFMAMNEAHHLNGTLPPDIIKNIQDERQRKLIGNSYLKFYSTNVLPNEIIISVRSKIYNLRKKLYGDVMDRDIGGQKGPSLDHLKKGNDPFRLIRTLHQVCRTNGIKLIVFLEPQLWVDKFYKINEFNDYRSDIKKFLSNEKITSLDYIDLIPNSAKYFHDFIHMTPEGYELLGKQLSTDFTLLMSSQVGRND